MHLLNFLNTHPTNWNQLLSRAPYNLTITNDRDYYLFKYSMLESDLTLPLCREARGCICRKNEDDEWICVCRSLDKFGNWGESYADTAKIDWSKGVDVQEKVDGSIIRLWFDNYYWHVSTNGVIDAFTAECGDTTFGNIFKSLVQEHESWNDFLCTLDTHYTYWFELVSPYNPIVVHYNESGIYYLGARNMDSMNEDYREISNDMLMFHGSWIKFPKHYHYNSLDGVLEACHNMGEDEEGYVCVACRQMENNSFLRIKCKGDEYLRRHRLRGNGPLTQKRIIEMWQEDSIDDFLAYFPEHKKFVDETIFMVIHLAKKADTIYNALAGVKNRRDFALYAKKWIKPLQSYFFARLDNKTDCAQTYFKQMKPKVLADLINRKEQDINA